MRRRIGQVPCPLVHVPFQRNCLAHCVCVQQVHVPAWNNRAARQPDDVEPDAVPVSDAHLYRRSRARPKLASAPRMSATQIHMPSGDCSWKDSCHAISKAHPSTQL